MKPVEISRMHFESCREVMANFTETMEENFIPILQAACDAFWQAYHEAGTPYGESNEGLLRWMREVFGKLQKKNRENTFYQVGIGQ